jgi:hypothetical protein
LDGVERGRAGVVQKAEEHQAHGGERGPTC